MCLLVIVRSMFVGLLVKLYYIRPVHLKFWWIFARPPVQLPCVSTNENHLKISRTWTSRLPALSGTCDHVDVHVCLELRMQWVCWQSTGWSVVAIQYFGLLDEFNTSHFCSINSNKTKWSSSFQYFQYFHSSIEKLANANSWQYFHCLLQW